jgi:sporulation protein YtfJ
MSEHPIQGLMQTAMESIKQMVDVNTVVGDAVQTGDGGVIIPVSRVSFGFAAGGGEYGTRAAAGDAPFGGGSGAGVSVQPVAFLVVHGDDVRLLPVDGNTALERLLDLTPDILDEFMGLFGKGNGTPHDVPLRTRAYADEAGDD